jgi:hypothetical protein
MEIEAAEAADVLGDAHEERGADPATAVLGEDADAEVAGRAGRIAPLVLGEGASHRLRALPGDDVEAVRGLARVVQRLARHGMLGVDRVANRDERRDVFLGLQRANRQAHSSLRTLSTTDRIT